MKKHLTLTIVLGAIVFISVSYLAQANEKKSPPASGNLVLAMDASVANFKPLAAPVLWPRY